MTSKIIPERMTFQIPGDPENVLERIWSIGGESGWYYGTNLWKFRGWLDKMTGGTGFRKGRRNPDLEKAEEIRTSSSKEIRLIFGG